MYPTPHNSRIDEILTVSEEKRRDYGELSKEITAVEEKWKKLREELLQRCNQSKKSDQIGGS